MAALVTVAGINTCTDQTVADIKTGPEGGFHIGTVIGVYIYRTYSDRLDEQQKAQILLRGGESFRKAVNQ